MMAVCTEKCRGCDYQKKFAGGHEGGMIYCDYISMEDHPRPCPAGEGCTEFRQKEAPWTPTPITIEPRKRGPKPKDMTEEEKAARRKEQVRVNARRYYERHREERKAYMREYNRANRDHINQKNRERIRKKREEMRGNG